MWRTQCKWNSGNQLSICSKIEENHGKPWSSWPVAGPSGCKLTSSQQSGIKYANPNVSPYLCVPALFEIKVYIFFIPFLLTPLNWLHFSARTAQKKQFFCCCIQLLPWKHACFVKQLLSNGCCTFIYLMVVAQQLIYMPQYMYGISPRNCQQLRFCTWYDDE
jgi:hypothetical protein